jgi:dephospho-CoA kinase
VKTLGLTGGFGTGKTTVLAMFKRLGAMTLCCDDIVHLQLKDNASLQKKISLLFGPDVLRKGRVDRRLLAKRVFNNPKHLAKLEGMIHPIVKKSIRTWIAQNASKSKNRTAICVVEVPLLFETGFDKLFNSTVVVATAPAIQKKRIFASGKFAPKDMLQRMRFQWPLDRKISACDFVIDNNKDKKQTFHQVKNLMDFFLKGGTKWKN